MEYKYLITDIQEKTKVSITSLNAFKNKHKDFFNQNSIRKQRKLYYTQAAMDFFVSYYCPEEAAEDGENPVILAETNGHAPEAEIPASAASSTDKPHESQPEAPDAEIAALKAEIAALREQLEKSEAERKELLRQNGALILTLQQSQQQALLLLPAPKKSIADKVKSFFGKRQEK